jgi:hypothetical protein
VSTPELPPSPDAEDLRALARGLRLLVEIGARTLIGDAGPSELALRVTNIQRGVDAYLAGRPGHAAWFGPSGGGFRPHEDMLSLIGGMPSAGPIRIRALPGAGRDPAEHPARRRGPASRPSSYGPDGP